MIRRRSVLGFVLPLLVSGAAVAQEATAPRRAAPRRRVDDRNAAYMGGGMVVQEPQGARPQGYTLNDQQRAPVPNSNIEAPRQQHADAAQISPGVIAPRIPGRGSAQDTGSPGSLQDRLFRPAPGAFLRIPLSW
jgi:hypothetical protein